MNTSMMKISKVLGQMQCSKFYKHFLSRAPAKHSGKTLVNIKR